MGFLEIEGLQVSYDKQVCIDGLDLSVEKGEIISILGPSGCGKSTLLKVISGLLHQDSGTVTIDGEDMNRMSPEKRPISMVFQRPLLFRNMNVENNVNYAPRLLGLMEKAELKEETDRMLRIVGLEGFGDRKATQLSGGQEQRVSLARALITKPKLLLLDEPFSALDASLRVEMRSSVRKICKDLGQTVIFVTHDQEEAIAMGDRIGLMMDGRIIQLSVAQEFYSHPKTLSVARFFGWKNCIECQYGENGLIHSPIGDYDVTIFDPNPDMTLMIVRPEAFYENVNGQVKGVIREASFMGVRVDYIIEANGQTLYASLDTSYLRRPGDEITLDINRGGIWLVEPETLPETQDDTDVKKGSFLSKLFGKGHAEK